MFFALTLVPFLYLLWRFILPARLGVAGKCAAALVLLVATQAYALDRLFFGGLASPDLPAWALMLQGWLLASSLLLFFLVLLRDCFRLLRPLARCLTEKAGCRMASRISSDKAGRRRLLRAGLASGPVLVGASLAPTALGVAAAVAVPRVREEEARLARLPAALDGLRVAQISDLHMSSLLRRDWVRAVVDQVNAQSPDLIVLTGDMVDGAPEARLESARELERLAAPLGVFACVGNHEYYSGYHVWTRIFATLGLHMLLNEHAVIDCGPKRGNQRLVLAGVTDRAALGFHLPGPDLDAALAGAPGGVPRILLDHRPGNAAANARKGIDLQLSGHTHGGHAPGMREIVAAFNNGYVRGWYATHGMPLYVSPGCGLWGGFPVRIATPSEIALLTLRAARA